jgi:hypothetical protein
MEEITKQTFPAIYLAVALLISPNEMIFDFVVAISFVPRFIPD